MARRLALVLIAGLVLAAPAAGDNSGKLGEVQARIAAARAKEARLTGQISDVTSQIRSLESKVGDVSQKLSILERDLALHQRRLDRLNALFSFETERLNFLRSQYAKVLRQLNLRMIDIYETQDPTLVEVILESKSFQDVLDQLHYLEAIARQDKRIAATVAVAREEGPVASERKKKSRTKVHVARERTKKIRTRVHSETQVVAVRTQQQREVKNQLLASQGSLAGKRKRQKGQLASTREQEKVLIAEANALAAEDARIRGQLAAAQGAGDTTPSSSGLIWPVNGPVTSPFGYRWGRLHAGIDIGVPYGTPIHAAASGTVVLAAWTGGYGNYTCIDHGGGLATCYAHQSSYAVSTGAHVTQGQVIGYVGSTGHSFGAHLHFEVRINGNPVDPLGYL
jgi:murein DD-endopeptidase MepM/ murein hydrolase activator NlpD